MVVDDGARCSIEHIGHEEFFVRFASGSSFAIRKGLGLLEICILSFVAKPISRRFQIYACSAIRWLLMPVEKVER